NAGSGRMVIFIAGNLTVGGDLIGGSGENSGVVQGGAVAGKLVVGGSLQGSDDVSSTGSVIFSALLNQMTVGGDIGSGNNTTADEMKYSGSVLVLNGA